MLRRVRLLLIVLAVIAALFVFALPPRTQQTAAPPSNVVRGAFHIHSNRSDGSGSVDAIATAAASAGLQFIVVTDHGNGTRPPDPPSYRSGVLVIDGVELNTTGGHLAVIGMPAAPYPLAGTPDDVLEDVHRLGGFGIAAHPGSPRPSLRWQEWDAPIDGLEWINSDSEWRDEPRLPLMHALTTYFFRAPQSMAQLLDRPVGVMARWDALTNIRPVLTLAGADAHARLGFRQRDDPDEGGAIHVRIPGYAASFRTFSNHVILDQSLSGDAAADASAVIAAIHSGHVYSVIDALATPGSLSFTATSGSHSARMGDTLAVEGDVMLHANAQAPPGTRLVLLRNGQPIQEVTGDALDMNVGREAAAYRIEAFTAGAPGGPAVPWLVSNPIYAGLVPPQLHATPLVPESRIPARSAEAAAESGPLDTSTVLAETPNDARRRRFAGDPAIDWTFALAPGRAVGQFAAVAVPVSAGLETFDRVRFTVSSSTPMRLWVQLRAPVGNTERWGATFYTDAEPRVIDIPFSRFNPIGVTSLTRAPLAQVESLLFVADTLNVLPGSSGRLMISEVGFVR